MSKLYKPGSLKELRELVNNETVCLGDIDTSKNASTFQLKRLSVLSKTYLRLNPNALVFSIKRKYVFPLCLKSPKFSLFIQKIYI